MHRLRTSNSWIDLADAISASSSDQTAKVGAVALARQALDFGSRYLFAKVAEEPATPPDLASAVRQQANAFQELLIGYINGTSLLMQANNRHRRPLMRRRTQFGSCANDCAGLLPREWSAVPAGPHRVSVASVIGLRAP